MNKYNIHFKHHNSIVLLALMTILTLNSCYKDRLKLDKFSGGEWNPNLAAPLFYGNLTMHKIIENSKDLWIEDPDGLLSVVYIGKQTTQIGDKLISIPDQQTDTTLPFILPPALGPGDSTSRYFTLTPEFTSPTNQRVDSILIKEGKLTIDITTNINHESYVELIIPQFSKYGVTFKEKLNIPVSSGGSTTIQKVVNLQDYWLRINNNGGTSNEVTEYIKVMVRKGNNADNSPYSITISQNIEDVTYFQAFGYFHKHSFDIDLTKIDISLFKHGAIFDATIEDAKLGLKFRNSYGMPIDVSFDKLYVEREDGTQMDITSSLLPHFTLNYPNFSNVGNSDTTNIIFTKQNSNIVDVINFDPIKLYYSGVSNTNPTGTIVPNFLIDTSKVSVQSTLEIPLYGRAILYSMQDTTKLDLENDYDWSSIVSMDINLNTNNQFPAKMSLQVYLADTNMVIIDSLFNGIEQIVEAAIPGPPPEYRVSTAVHYMATARLTNTRLDNLRNAANMIVSAKGSTYDQGNKIIKIYSDYKLDFEISAKAEYKTDY